MIQRLGICHDKKINLNSLIIFILGSSNDTDEWITDAFQYHLALLTSDPVWFSLISQFSFCLIQFFSFQNHFVVFRTNILSKEFYITLWNLLIIIFDSISIIQFSLLFIISTVLNLKAFSHFLFLFVLLLLTVLIPFSLTPTLSGFATFLELISLSIWTSIKIFWLLFPALFSILTIRNYI